MTEEADLEPTSEAVWSRPDEWATRQTPEGCVICRSGRPLDVIAEFATCWATTSPQAALPGYVCIVARKHYVEPFEMPPEEQAQFWQQAMAIAAAVDRVVKPIKMNYEIHGNTLPHVHIHLFPRQPDDPYVGGPIDRRATFVRSENELDLLAEGIRAAG
jgi:diadenosine tetraphosphate (Ap4A) HIT family hydrolase